MAPVTATGVPNPEAPLEEGAEAEGDQQELQSTVLAHAGDAVLHHFEVTSFQRELVEEDDVENDPANGHQAEGSTVDGGLSRHADRHSIDKGCNQQRGDQTIDRRHVRLDAEDAERAEQDDDRDSSNKRRQPCIAERIIDLRPDHRYLP
jgi:hypothetical protein